ncbi:hypothetical protein EJC51_00550 [Streptomyces aquilus]|uniref:Uncharacterized protein n=1 Tax=Streptomyces aquilus TaxID=2548456 RepID=A0A3S5HMD7_9ACTN|nr:hypothetical protein EJC51_00550 [Streptomyces aquilus]
MPREAILGSAAADRIASALGTPNPTEYGERAHVTAFVVRRLIARGLLTDLSAVRDTVLVNPDQVDAVCSRPDLAAMVAADTPLGPDQASRAVLRASAGPRGAGRVRFLDVDCLCGDVVIGQRKKRSAQVDFEVLGGDEQTLAHGAADVRCRSAPLADEGVACHLRAVERDRIETDRLVGSQVDRREADDRAALFVLDVR